MATERQRVSSGSPYEATIGFSRAVRAGDRVLVAGTAPVWPDARRLLRREVDEMRAMGLSQARSRSGPTAPATPTPRRRRGAGGLSRYSIGVCYPT